MIGSADPAFSPGQGAPSTIRCIKTGHHRWRGDAAQGSVREHPAPSGALRLSVALDETTAVPIVREHPAPSGALRHNVFRPERVGGNNRQGAPSTIRCIKTDGGKWRVLAHDYRQGAPSTIRCIKTGGAPASPPCARPVREHPAPSGALRPKTRSHTLQPVPRQGAPSTIRCIKTPRLARP